MLVLEPQSIALGTMTKLSPKTFEANLRNTGTEDVSITDVRPGCGSCTVARVTSTIIPAGGVAQLIATFTPQSTGTQYKTINVQYEKAGLRSMVSFNFNAAVV